MSAICLVEPATLNEPAPPLVAVTLPPAGTKTTKSNEIT